MGVAVTGSPTVKSTVMMSPNITTSARPIISSTKTMTSRASGWIYRAVRRR
jgi:hypothetical protein